MHIYITIAEASGCATSHSPRLRRGGGQESPVSDLVDIAAGDLPSWQLGESSRKVSLNQWIQTAFLNSSNPISAGGPAADPPVHRGRHHREAGQQDQGDQGEHRGAHQGG